MKSLLIHIFSAAFASTVKKSILLENIHKSSTTTPKLLLISLDGLRHDYITTRIAKNQLPNFQRLIKRSAYAEELTPAFPSITSPCHTTMATGKHPDKHGVLANIAFHGPDDKWTRTYSWFESMKLDWWFDAGAEPIWITAARQGLKTGGYHFPGSYVSNKGHYASRRELITSNNDIMLDDPRFEQVWRYKVDRTINWLFYGDEAIDDLGPLDFVALYFGEPDHSGHANGPLDVSKMDYVLEKMDDLIGYLLDTVDSLNLNDKLNVIITSDHGMMDFDSKNDFLYWKKLRNEYNISALGEYKMQVPQDAFAWIEPRLGKNRELFDALKLLQQDPENHIEGVYRKSGRKEDQFPEEFRTMNHERTPDILIVMEPGFVVLPIDPVGTISFISGLKAEHGWNNSYSEMHPTLFAFGPNFIEETRVENLHQVDIYPLMTHLLKIEPDEGVDGDLSLSSWKPVLREVEEDVTTVSPDDPVTEVNKSRKLNSGYFWLILVFLMASF